MKRIAFFVFCLTGMALVVFSYRFLVTGISHDFGLGFALGIVVTVALYWLNDVVSRPSKKARGGNDSTARSRIGTEPE